MWFLTSGKWVSYIPSQYVPGTPAPFIVCQDAANQRDLPTILDNMIADHRVPVMVAVFIGKRRW